MAVATSLKTPVGGAGRGGSVDEGVLVATSDGKGTLGAIPATISTIFNYR